MCYMYASIITLVITLFCFAKLTPPSPHKRKLLCCLNSNFTIILLAKVCLNIYYLLVLILSDKEKTLTAPTSITRTWRCISFKYFASSFFSTFTFKWYCMCKVVIDTCNNHTQYQDERACIYLYVTL